MNKVNSVSSNNSGTSSETSETQSVEENNTSELGTAEKGTSRLDNRISKVWKRMKDSNSEKDAVDVKRPPWRAVSVSTLPKPDKNALLRAKLLDASRRLRAGKSSISVQTDILPTKLMKEVNLGTQSDLLHVKDIGILTDGSFTMRKQGSGEFILTYSVSQMTEAIQLIDVSTQTLLPKVSGDGFMDAYYSNDPVDVNEYNSVERKLIEQIRHIRESRISRSQLKSTVNNNKDGNISEDSLSGTDTDTTETKTTIEEAPIPTYKRRSPHKPTYASWHFDYDDQNGLGKYFTPYTILRGRHNLIPKLVPTVDRGHDQEYRSVNIKAFTLNAIDELILESNNLVDCVEDFRLQRELFRKHAIQESEIVPPLKPKAVVLPSEYWLPIIEKQEKELDEKLKTLKSPKIKKYIKKRYNLTKTL